jgi:dTDP-4-amino-4,6-dideoxygalactose transaminase
VTRAFERALCEYTGAKYAVTTTSCTMAIQIACAYWRDLPSESWAVSMPKRSYVGVPAAILNAGFDRIVFKDIEWSGEYIISPLPVFDSARRFTSGMFKHGMMQCLSFHASKILGDSQGGCILHNIDEADAWLRRARFDGRTEGADPKTDQVQWPSWHAYLSPDVAARLLWRLSVLPMHNADLPNSDYPDLSTMEAFK